MKTDDLIKDPVFQLNLLLWMAKEQPPNAYRITPFFYNLEFKIIYIEQPFAFPEDTSKAMKSSGLEISDKPEPDLILWREKDNKALYFEAKANSFGVDSSNSIQARAHLMASGPAFGEVYKAPSDSCLLCYLLPIKARMMMYETLGALANGLKDKGLMPGKFSTHGLNVDKTQIIYSWDKAFKIHSGTKSNETSVLNDVMEDTDPAPLILVYSDEDCYNEERCDFYRKVIIEQVRACLLCDLHEASIREEYNTTPEKILEKTTDGIFQYLGRIRQRGLSRLIRENILKKIREHWKEKQSGVILSKDQLSITWNNVEEKNNFLNWLEDRHTHFDANKPPEEDYPLLDSLRESYD